MLHTGDCRLILSELAKQGANLYYFAAVLRPVGSEIVTGPWAV